MLYGGVRSEKKRGKKKGGKEEGKRGGKTMGPGQGQQGDQLDIRDVSNTCTVVVHIPTSNAEL